MLRVLARPVRKRQLLSRDRIPTSRAEIAREIGHPTAK
jgi:hypothetical protein